MQRVQYTQEQIDKLLKMCKTLFPEYKQIHVNGAFLYLNKGEVPLDTIPIFEFCMLYIFPKVQQVFNAEQLTNFYYVILGYNKRSQGNKDWDHKRFIHPVDYLFSEFLKLT